MDYIKWMLLGSFLLTVVSAFIAGVSCGRFVERKYNKNATKKS